MTGGNWSIPPPGSPPVSVFASCCFSSGVSVAYSAGPTAWQVTRGRFCPARLPFGRHRRVFPREQLRRRLFLLIADLLDLDQELPLNTPAGGCRTRPQWKGAALSRFTASCAAKEASGYGRWRWPIQVTFAACADLCVARRVRWILDRIRRTGPSTTTSRWNGWATDKLRPPRYSDF